MKIRCLLYALFISFLAPQSLSAESNGLLFRISVENTENHVQTKAVQYFSELLEENFRDRLDVKFYHSAALFRDSEVIRALTRGDIEMAVPGTWQLDRFVPEVGYFLMPQFFGADSERIDLFFNENKGQDILNRIEHNLSVKVPGLWMDLGSAHVFTTDKVIKDFKDFNGLRIRVAGGIANKIRVEILGAEGTIIPWPDLPQRLKDNSIDGLLTTFETVKSAELWKLGVKYVFTDAEYFAQYVPIVSSHFWNLLTVDEQNLFSGIWNQVAVQQRVDAVSAQRDAMCIAEKNGIIITEPSEEQMEEAKFLLLSRQNVILAGTQS